MDRPDQPRDRAFAALCFTDGNTVWACGNNGAIIHTTDGGAT